MTVTTPETEQDAEARYTAVSADVQARLAVVRLLTDQLAAEVELLVNGQRQINALTPRLQIREPVPDVRVAVAKRILSRLGSLRPYVPFETTDDEVAP